MGHYAVVLNTTIIDLDHTDLTLPLVVAAETPANEIIFENQTITALFVAPTDLLAAPPLHQIPVDHRH